jgi:hypothetical protein
MELDDDDDDVMLLLLLGAKLNAMKVDHAKRTPEYPTVGISWRVEEIDDENEGT